MTVTAQSSDGKDLTSARLLIDGQLISRSLDGKPIAVNPGRHRVVIQTSDGRVEQTVVANEGEKARLIRLVLGRDGAEVEASDGPTVLEALPWVLAGVSVVAFGAFTYLAVDGTSDLRELRDTCAPTCPEGSLDSVKRQLLFADIMLVLGGVSAASSNTLFIVGASSSSDQKRRWSPSTGSSEPSAFEPVMAPPREDHPSTSAAAATGGRSCPTSSTTTRRWRSLVPEKGTAPTRTTTSDARA